MRAILLALVSSLVVSTAALAHARLVGSAPEDGAVLDAPPAEIVLRFDSLVEKRFARFSLEDGDGAPAALAGPEGEGAARVLHVPLPELGAGRYALRFSVVSRDGHRVGGVVRFVVR